MYYLSAAERLKAILTEDGIDTSESFRNSLFAIVSEMCNYTEEDHRIRPCIILGKNLNLLFETIPNRMYIVMYRDSAEGEAFSRFFKSLALFCDNGWLIVVNSVGDSFEYGLFRRFSDISDRSLEHILMEQDDDDRFQAILLQAKNSYELSIDRAGRQTEVISFRLYDDKYDTREDDVINQLITDVLSERVTDADYKKIKSAWRKMAIGFMQKVHGTILLVVSEDYVATGENNRTLAGIVMEKPIDYYEEFRKAITVESYSQAERISVLMEAFYEMLNTDGITIVTTKGAVCGFNVFYSSNELPTNIKGGARKRTAKGILADTTLTGVIGVYFQSQDGEIFYERKAVQ